MLPAYIPNNIAVLTGGGKPVDFGKYFIDGKRILGDGKTFRGFFGGIAGGMSVGIIEYGIEALAGLSYFSSLEFLRAIRLFIGLSAGALIGDMFGSFIKRRFGVERGSPFPVLDQLDFVFGAFLISYLFTKRTFLELFSIKIIITAVIITPVLHILVNFLAYKIGKKDVPW